jgi:hypothetical protein
MIAPAVAGTPIYLSRTRRKRKSIRAQAYRSGVWVPIRAQAAFAERRHSNGLYNFITPKGPRPIEPAPGILLSIPLGNAAR